MKIPKEYLVALQEAQNRLTRGDASGAIHIGEQLLRAMPRISAVPVLLGRAYAAQGNTQQSLTKFRAATELAPGDPGVWTEFVAALLKAGQKGRARKVAQKAPVGAQERRRLLDIADNGQSLSTGPSLGGASLEDIRRIQSLLQSSKAVDARMQASELLKVHPESSALLNLVGVAALAMEDFETAEKLFLETIRISPQFAGAQVNLGLARARQGNYQGAISSFLEALKLDPVSRDARKNLVLAAEDSENHDLALEHAQALLQDSQEDPDVLKAYATALSEKRQFDKAFEVMDRLEKCAGVSGETRLMHLATLIDADRIEEAQAFAEAHRDAHPELALEASRLSAQLGDLDGARDDLRRLIEERGDQVTAFARYGRYGKWSNDDPMLSKLEAAADGIAPGSKGEPGIFYALAKARLDLGEDALGFEALHRANAAQRFIHDDSLEKRRSLEIVNRWTRDRIDNLASSVGVDFAPIFIIGTPRSGSTLLEHVIAAHPAVSSVGEDSIIAPHFPVGITGDKETFIKAVDACMEECRRLVPPNAVLLDKLLHNFMRVGALAAAFPKARFVQTSRDPRAVALSIYRNEFNSTHTYSTDLENIARFYADYLRYMAHWKRVLGERIIEVRYETLVADPEPEIRSLIDKLGLDWDDACLKPEEVQKRVKTLSVAQVRSGINSGSSDLWKRFEDYLAPFTKIAAEVWDFEAGEPRVTAATQR